MRRKYSKPVQAMCIANILPVDAAFPCAADAVPPSNAAQCWHGGARWRPRAPPPLCRRTRGPPPPPTRLSMRRLPPQPKLR